MIDRVFLLFGPKGGGKDHFYNVSNVPNKTRIALADSLVDMTYSLIGYTPVDYEKFKRSVCIVNCDNPLQGSTGLGLINRVGKAMKDVDNSFWIDRCVNKILKHSDTCHKNKRTCNIFVTDVRFRDEVIKLREDLKEYVNEFVYVFCNHTGSDKYHTFLNNTEEWNTMTLWMVNNKDLLGISDESVSYFGEETIQALLTFYTGK